MKIEILGKNNYKPTKADIKYVERKLAKINNYFEKDDVKEIICLLKDYRQYKKVEITIYAKKDIIRAEEKAQTINAGIDLAVDKIVRQITKHRDKLYTRYRGSGKKEEKELDLKSLEKELLAKQLVKNKKIILTPLTNEEAILALELIDHDFYIYYDIDLKKTCVIYKREDGGFALIETDIKKD